MRVTKPKLEITIEFSGHPDREILIHHGCLLKGEQGLAEIYWPMWRRILFTLLPFKPIAGIYMITCGSKSTLPARIIARI